MPVILPKEKTAGFSAPIQREIAPTPVTWGDTFEAAFGLENDVVNAVEMTQRDMAQPDTFDYRAPPKFDIVAKAKENPDLFASYPKSFYDVDNEWKYHQRVAQIREEERRRDVLAASGWGGTLAAISAGVLSPVNFIPLIGTGSRGLRALAEGAASGAAAGAIQSGVLSMAQEGRDTGDLLFDVGAGAVVGGILGPIAGRLSANELRGIEDGFFKELDEDFGPKNFDEGPGPEKPPLTEDDLDIPEGRFKNDPVDEVTGEFRTKWGDALPFVGFAVGKLNKPIRDAKLIEMLGRMRNGQEAAKWLARRSNNPVLREVNARLVALLPNNVSLHLVKEGDMVPQNIANAFNTGGTIALHSTFKGIKMDDPTKLYQVYFRADADEVSVTHELVHALTWKKIETDPAFEARIRKLQRYLDDNPHLVMEAKNKALTDPADAKDGMFYHGYGKDNLHELLTVGFTDPRVQKLWKEIPYENGRSFWGEFVETLRQLIGLGPHKWSVMDELLAISDDALVLSKQEAKVAEAALGAPVSAGAKSVKQLGAGGLKGIGGTRIQTDVFSKAGGPITRSPVVQVINNKLFPKARNWMAQLHDAGLRLEGNQYGRLTAEGGTVANRAKQWYNGLARSIKAVDDSYNSYMYGENVPSLFAGTRAVVRGAFHANGKMDKFSFKGEIARALREGEEFDGPKEAMEAAAEIRRLIYDPITEAAIDVGLISRKEVENIVGDVTYLNRVYNNAKIMADRGRFVDILAANYQKKMDLRAAKAFKKFQEKQLRDRETIEDFELQDPVELEEIRNFYGARLKELLENPMQSIEDRLAEMRSNRLVLKQKLKTSPTGVVEVLDDGTQVTRTKADLDKMWAAEQELLKQGGEPLQKLRAERAAIKRRLSNLNKSVVAYDERQFAKLQKIERTEENQLGTLRRMVQRINKVDKKLSKVLPGPERDKLLDDLVKKLTKRQGVLKELQDKIDDWTPEEAAEYSRRAEAIDRLLRRINKVDSMADTEQLLKQLREEIFAKTNTINSKRALRIASMKEAAKKLDPELVQARIKGLKEGMKTRALDLYDRLRQEGFDDVDVEKGVANSRELALKMAREVTDKIVGTFNRLPGMDIIQGERGPELARVLDIPSRDIEDFLENDVELLMRNYVRTMGADIEMMRKFGTVDMSNEFRELVQDFETAQRAAKTDAEKQKIAREYELVKRNLEAVVSRLRHTWGIPDNPYGAATRLARVMQNLNTMRFMGSVLVSSVPDMAQPVLKYGLVRTFRDGFLPLIKNFKEFRLSSKEAILAGTALDVILHSRAHAMFDILDNFGRTSKAERALEFATSRIGMVALFDYWTAGMKQFSAVTANAELLEGIQTAVTGKKGLKSLSKAQELLAAAGIDGQRANHIWSLVSKTSGGGQRNGVWMPNTEEWLRPEVYKAAGIGLDQAQEALRTYRAALVGEVDRIIVTPGAERPLWMDGKSLTLRLVAQFRSFAFASTQRTVMAGLQQADMAVVHGAMFSLVLGALSYYLWASFTGGEAYEEMMSAGPDKWADEAIARSGLIGTLGEVQRIGEAIPLTQDFVNFSGTQSTRRGGGSLLEATAGPSFDLAQRAARIVTDADSPTQGTAHAVRTMLPLQNVFFLRQLFDAIEESGAEYLPEQRQ